MAEGCKDYLFAGVNLPQGVVADLRRLNPWWTGQAMRDVPKTRRHLVEWIHRRLKQRLAPIVVVRGPRQIGKTIAQFHVIQDLLEQGIEPQRILRVQFEERSDLGKLREPILRVVDWYESVILKRSLNDAAKQGQPAFIFLDEAQNLRGWDTQLKALVDASTVQVVVTGSSALRLEMGRDSLSGRITTIEAGVLSLTEIAAFHGMDVGKPRLADNGLDVLASKEWWHDFRGRAAEHAENVREAFRWFSERGGYPLAHERADVPWSMVADQLNENVIRRVIQHDLRVGERGRRRDAALLEEVFRLACRYIGQSPGLGTLSREVQRVLNANVGPGRVQQYLRFLDNTLLLRVVRPLEIRLKRQRGNAKLCLADHALRASWLGEQVPIDPARLATEPHLADLAGRVAESVVGALLSSIYGLDLNHLPPRTDQPEIDYVMTVGTRRIPVEVKYQRRIDPLGDTEAIRTFIERTANNAPFGLLITLTPVDSVVDQRIITLPLSDLMLIR